LLKDAIACAAAHRYALNGKEVKSILKQRLVKVDGKTRTDTTYPAGFMDVVEIEKTDEHFRLVYDTKGRFVVHRISREEATYKLCKVRMQRHGQGGVPFIATHDGRTVRYPDPEIKVRGMCQLKLAPASVFRACLHVPGACASHAYKARAGLWVLVESSSSSSGAATSADAHNADAAHAVGMAARHK
jgi:ribosomal protein S4E